MCRHVILTLRRVHKERVAIRRQSREETLQIAAHIRVGILLNQQRGRCMFDMQREQTVLRAILRNPPGYLVGDFVQAAPSGADS